MGRASRQRRGAKKTRQKRGYSAPRMARELVPKIEPQRLVRVWRRLLERRLRNRLQGHVAVELHDNTHTMVTYRRRRGRWALRLHHMFLAATDDVLHALASFVRGADSESSAALDRFINANKALIRRVSLSQLRRRVRLDPSGRHHDLQRIFDELNRRYFKNRITASITYGPAPRVKTPRKSIKMGSYSSDSRVIRIHPALDRRVVPRYFVSWIVFHEMLHEIYRARRASDGRRSVHPPEFTAHERRFHDYRRAQAWEDNNLDVLLRAR